MKKTLFVSLVATVLSYSSALGQNDPVLFTVKNIPVHVSEFNYIYTKTNGNKADFSKASVEEYLDLYTKFKMKVARAHDMKLDTVPSLQEELGGYRRQLADSYLTDKEVTEKLVKEAHNRIQKDINISHILVKIEKGDAMAALKQIQAIKARLDKGEVFETVAKEASQDANTKAKGGYLGFLTALLPEGFYGLETAMYTTPLGKSSDIVQSPLGYHIIKVNEVRPARGEMEIAHIMIRKVKDGIPQPFAKQKADSLLMALRTNKADFSTLAMQQSDDANSAGRGGYLGFFGIGRYELTFEDAAFGLKKDGDFSAVAESSIGYHIIKRISAKPIESYETMKSRLKSRIQQDSRFELAKSAMIERIKKESTFKETPINLTAFIQQVDSTFQTFAWKSNYKNGSDVLFNIGVNSYTVNDFSTYLVNNANRRLSLVVDTKNDYALVSRMMYQDFVNEKVLAYEETQLDVKYSEFKNLMREYEEGILLFEAIKINVWDKASQDSVGLEKFYNTNKSKYMWGERAQVVTYSVLDSAKAQIEDIRKYAEKHSPQDVIKKFNKKKDIVSFSSDTSEKSKNKVADSLGWVAGAMSKTEQNASDKSWQFTKIDKILPAMPKVLKEARGFVVADYQEYLEKKWMEELTASYKVNVNKDVLESLIKK